VFLILFMHGANIKIDSDVGILCHIYIDISLALIVSLRLIICKSFFHWFTQS